MPNHRAVVLAALCACLPVTGLAETVVYVAFNEPLRHTISYAKGTVTNVTCNQPQATSSGVRASTQQSILTGLQSVFQTIGVPDVRFTAQPVSNPDVTVLVDTRPATGPEGFLLEKCTGLDLDRFNRNRGEEVVVNLNLLTTGATNLDIAVQTIAHEVGHAFGLRHVRSPGDNTQTPLGIMRPGGNADFPLCRDNCRFLDEVMPLYEMETDVLNFFGNSGVLRRFDSNPVFHLRRHVAREDRSTIIASGTCPGTWDERAVDRRRIIRLRSSTGASGKSVSELASVAAASDLVLYEVNVNEWYGNDIPRQLAFAAEMTLDELSRQEWNIPENSFLELIASSSPGAPSDITLGVVEEGALNRNVDPGVDGQTLSIVQLAADNSLQVLADLVTEVQLVTVFNDTFETDPNAAPTTTAGASRKARVAEAGASLNAMQSLVGHRLRSSFEAAALGEPLREDFNGFSNGASVPTLFDGLVTFSGAGNTPTVFFGAWSLFGNTGPNPFAGGALIPEPRFDPRDLVVNFREPVFAFGADFYDDASVADVISVVATSVDGHTATIAENSSRSGYVGFLGFTSEVGIASVTLRIRSNSGGAPNGNQPMEIDLFTVHPDPCAQ